MKSSLEHNTHRRKAPAVLLLVLCLTGCGSSIPGVEQVKQHLDATQLELGDPILSSVNLVMVTIPAGEFMMGLEEKKGNQLFSPSYPSHKVKISQPFYLSAFEITQQQYEQVMGEKPWSGQPLVQEGDHYAASYISWKKAAEFCKKLSEQENVKYRLPTEAEWEYACRAGSSTAFSFGNEAKQLGEFAWYNQNAYKQGQQYPHQVGLKKPNAWGLYDMHGNTWEWCQDFYAPYNPKKTVTVDPQGPTKGNFRVWRGGSFADDAIMTQSFSRVSYKRANYKPEYLSGFRIARDYKKAP